MNHFTFFDDIILESSQNFDFSNSSFSQLKSIFDKSWLDSNNNQPVYNDIIKFYSFQKIISEIKKNKILNHDELSLVEDYQQFTNEFSKKLFFYIFFTALIETRHANVFNENFTNMSIKNDFIDFLCDNNNLSFSKNFIKNHFDEKVSSLQYSEKINFLKNNLELFMIPEDFLENLNKKYDPFNYLINELNISDKSKFIDFYDVIKEISNISNRYVLKEKDNEIIQKILKEDVVFDSVLDNLSIGECLNFLEKFFLTDFPFSFGGIPWENIVSHLKMFVNGSINSEIFIDTTFSLEHNNGHIFNKNFIFDYFSNLDKFDIHISQLGNYNSSKLQSNSFSSEINSQQILKFIFNIQSSSNILSFINPELKTKYLILSKNSLNDDFTKNFLNLNSDNSLTIMNELLLTLKSFTNFNSYILDEPILQNFVEKYSTFIHKYSQINSKEFFSQFEFSDNYIENNNFFFDKIDFILNYPLSYLENKSDFNIYSLNDKTSKNLVGNKFYNLQEVHNINLNVPSAICLDSKTCLTFLSSPDEFYSLYFKNKNKIYDFINNDLVSVRSGAIVSMPGMMDTILNVGIDDLSYLELCKKYSKDVINECSISFMKQLSKSLFGESLNFDNLDDCLINFKKLLSKYNVKYNSDAIFPLDKNSQILLCIKSVFNSWNSERAIQFRNNHNISHDLGTACIIQKMVLGNQNNNSYTGIIFSSDCINGSDNLIGHFKIKAQGEELVSGESDAQNIQEFKKINPDLYQELYNVSKQLEKHFDFVQDIEFTIENNKLYILQTRNAVLSSKAQIYFFKKYNNPKYLSENFTLEQNFIETDKQPNFIGECANPGIIKGIVVKNQQDIDKFKEFGEPLIFLSYDSKPEFLKFLIQTDAFLTGIGSSTCHTAIVARSMNKPCIISIKNNNSTPLFSGEFITIDASKGFIWSDDLPIVNNINHELNDIIDNKNTLAINFENKKFSSWNSQLENSIKTYKEKKLSSLKEKILLAFIKNNQNKTTLG